jgi:hypothetical protein
MFTMRSFCPDRSMVERANLIRDALAIHALPHRSTSGKGKEFINRDLSMASNIIVFIHALIGKTATREDSMLEKASVSVNSLAIS